MPRDIRSRLKKTAPTVRASPIISYALWRSRFAGDPAAIGRTLNIDGAPTRVAGVLPPDFVMPTLTHADILLPEALDEARERQGRAFRVFARLRPGVTLPQAQSALQPYFARILETVPPRFRKEITLRLRPVRDRQVGDARAASLALLGAVLAVLLIACANIANLLLARAVGRDREIAVRTALGASRIRLVRLALTESLLLAAAGGAAGCALAFLLLRAFQAIAPEALPRIGEATVDLRVLAFSAAAAVLSGVLFGLFPALRRTESGVLGSARTVGPAHGWLRGALVTAQIAISVILLTGAGLLLRSLDNLERVPMGFESDHVITASFVLGRQRYSRDVEQLALFRELEQRLERLPGVSAAAVSDSIPPFGGTRGRPLSTIDVEGRPQPAEGSGGMVAWRYVTPGYFAAHGDSHTPRPRLYGVGPRRRSAIRRAQRNPGAPHVPRRRSARQAHTARPDRRASGSPWWEWPPTHATRVRRRPAARNIISCASPYPT